LLPLWQFPPLCPKPPESIPELNIIPELFPGTQVVNMAACDVIAGAAATIMTVRAAAESKRNFFMVNPPSCFKIITFLLQNYNIIKFLEDIPVNNGFFSNSFLFPCQEGIPVFLPE
jgi:hypothetical protein